MSRALLGASRQGMRHTVPVSFATLRTYGAGFDLWSDPRNKFMAVLDQAKEKGFMMVEVDCGKLAADDKAFNIADDVVRNVFVRGKV